MYMCTCMFTLKVNNWCLVKLCEIISNALSHTTALLEISYRNDQSQGLGDILIFNYNYIYHKSTTLSDIENNYCKCLYHISMYTCLGHKYK